MIGVFDSGLGGLSVLRAVRSVLPTHDLLYLADSAYCPYGPRPVAEVQQRALACAGWLVANGAALVVVACNTATSAAIDLLRSRLVVPVIGMEPGIKPAIEATRSGQIAVLATSGTLGGERFGRLVERYASGTTVTTLACPDLVAQVEAGELQSARTRSLVAGYLAPLRAQDVDTIVLGCTHFPFLRPLIAELGGAATVVIDTGPAVARQVARVVIARGIGSGSAGLGCATSGRTADVGPALARVWGEPLPLVHADC